jgi:hypothetical protein
MTVTIMVIEATPNTSRRGEGKGEEKIMPDPMRQLARGGGRSPGLGHNPPGAEARAQVAWMKYI